VLLQRGRQRFQVAKLNLYGNPNIGVYLVATDKYVLVPDDIAPDEEQVIREVLGVDRVLRLRVLGMKLLGVMIAGNSNGVLLPPEATLEAEILKRELDVNVGILPSRNNAVGNIVVANDRAALVFPGLEPEAVEAVRDYLGVEVVKGQVAGVQTVGAALVVTNRGGVVHPEAGEDEIRWLEDLFKVPIEPATINFGVELVRTGLVANSYGALVGEDTTGPEIARIQLALGGGGLEDERGGAEG
jgi:translation initiation factor 6